MTARGEPLEAFEIDRHIAQPAMREVADQIPRGIGPERLAQLQQAVAQAVAGFLGALMQSQEIGQPLAIDRLASSVLART